MSEPRFPSAHDAARTPGEATAWSTGFASTLIETPLRATPPTSTAPAVFDVCHVGVVLRALLFVQGVMALGTAFVARQVSDWVLQFSAATVVGLPALVVWLAGVCAAQRLLSRWPVAWQWLALVPWGAVCASGAAAVWGHLQWADLIGTGPLQTWAVAGTGAAMAAAFLFWMRQRVERERPAAAAARLAELQSRIRPHFLFNTLNTAIVLVRVDPGRAEAVLEDLAELFRVALNDGDATAVSTVRDEVELARRYLAIEQVRFGERLAVQWELDPQAQSAKLPALLLQPLVENAVRHGIEPSPQGGMVAVRTRARRGRIEILVVNSLPTEASRPGHGIGQRNVRERLRLMHDVAGEFTAGRDGEQYRVRIVVPA